MPLPVARGEVVLQCRQGLIRLDVAFYSDSDVASSEHSVYRRV